MDRTPGLHDILAHKAKADDWCMNELVRQYDPLIGKFTRALLPGMTSTTADDLRQIGVLTFMELVPLYDIERASFMTFAYRWLPLKMKRNADGEFPDRLVSPPINVLSADRAKIKCGEESNFPLNAAFSISGRSITGTDGEPIGEDEFLCMIAPEMVQEDSTENLVAKQVWAAVDSLPHQDVTLLRLYYQQGQTLEQIAKMFGRSRQAINVALAKALHRLQYKLGIHNEYTHTDIRIKHVRSVKQASQSSR